MPSQAIARTSSLDSIDLDEDKSTYGDAAIYFDAWSLSEPYLSSISSPSLSDFTYNGRVLSDVYVDLREIMGREPDDDGLYYDTYWMEYRWDHKGSTATLTVNTPATDESPAEINVSVSWRTASESSDAPADNFADSSSYTSTSIMRIKS